MQIEIRDTGDSKLRIEKNLMQPSKSSRRGRHSGVPVNSADARRRMDALPPGFRLDRSYRSDDNHHRAVNRILDQAPDPQERIITMTTILSCILSSLQIYLHGPMPYSSWEQALPSATRVGVRRPRFFDN
jgi:hypothetical protein